MTKTPIKVLTRSQIKRFRKILDSKAEEIRNNLHLSDAAKTLANIESLNLEDLPGQSHEEWILLSRNNIDVMLLREVEEAIKRITALGFGTCLECEKPIAMNRLEAVSWARHCVTCQEELAFVQGDSRVQKPLR